MTTLKKNYEFKRLYNKGKSTVNPYMVVYCRKNGLSDKRVGFTVSTKIGHAVVRNRVRRRLKEIYRLNLDRLAEGVDIVVVARGRCVDADYHQLEAAFIDSCGKLGIVKG